MSRKVVRKIELYALHAHEQEDEIDYGNLFSVLSRVPREHRIFDVSGIIVGFPIVRRVAGGYFIQAAEGDPGASALVFNVRTGGTRDAELGSSELLSQATHLFVDPTTRRAAVEFVRGGVRASMLGAAIEGILRARSDRKELRVEFSAVPTADFVETIDEFTRIRVASLRLIEPNASWTDHYTSLSDLMEQSNGGKVEVDVLARREGSLANNSGIVQAIKDVATDAQPYLDDARIVGNREGEANETTLRLSKHIEHTRATVDASDSGVAAEPSIRNALIEFVKNRVIGLQ